MILKYIKHLLLNYKEYFLFYYTTQCFVIKFKFSVGTILYLLSNQNTTSTNFHLPKSMYNLQNMIARNIKAIKLQMIVDKYILYTCTYCDIDYFSTQHFLATTIKELLHESE